jgi:hypothetical protein
VSHRTGGRGSPQDVYQRLRRDRLPYMYPLHRQNLETMRAYYEELGEIPPANRLY